MSNRSIGRAGLRAATSPLERKLAAPPASRTNDEIVSLALQSRSTTRRGAEVQGDPRVAAVKAAVKRLNMAAAALARLLGGAMLLARWGWRVVEEVVVR